MSQEAVKKPKPGFGSFHSGNVEEMIEDPKWQPPEEPEDVSSTMVSLKINRLII